MTTVPLGKLGENLACDYLKSLGYHIVVKNYRCRLGEIDLVALDKKSYVFVEVKTRYSTQCGQPFESVNYHKQRRLICLAQVFLKHHFRTVDIASRFDVVSIVIKGDQTEIKHIKNAFFASSYR